ncbi:hypothetical protein [Sphingomonas parapaucimobilis]|uniref:hypothetical protein n=1 Tax=Sphingomonas parapaucimobilis TaxID=28213 RepID=UPI000AFAC55F|nr:hypothetical protein [Sphingomonas parapaucimobilis]
MTITAAVLRAALLAFGLPLFVPFFWPLSVRIAAVALVALAWGLWRYLRRRAAAPPRRRAAVPPCRRAACRVADAIAAELAGLDAADEEGKPLGR